MRQTLLRLLESGTDEDRVLAEAEKRARPGQPLFSSLVYVLAHLTFAEGQARRHWQRIVEHRAQLTASLGRDVGMRVAMLDYFVNVTRELKSPKVIEISIFERTQRRALTDGLTGLFNRTYFQHALRRELNRARRHGLELSVVMLDLDDFKRINDSRGHAAGDRALVRAAGMVAASLREVDVCARYGGEEFALVLPETGHEGAYVVAERIRQRVEQDFARMRGPRVTISGGVATFPEDALDAKGLVREADRLLYRAKSEGKNKVLPPDPHRRRHPRHRLICPVDLAVGSRRVIPGVTLNASEGGLLVAAPVGVEVGARVGLVLRPENAPQVSLRAQVVRSEPAADLPGGGYALGVRLLSDGRRNRAVVDLWQSSPADEPVAPLVTR
jgi:diguanylate cyclase (GGDEF)-like protein